MNTHDPANRHPRPTAHPIYLVASGSRPPGVLRARLRPGGVLNMAVAVLAGGTIVTTTALMTLPAVRMSATSASFKAVEPMTNNELAVALIRVGLDAPSLAAAGLTSVQVTEVVADGREYLTPRIQALRDADELVGSTGKERDRLERLVQSGQASPSDVEAFGSAKTAAANAILNRQGILDALFAAATDSLGGAAPVTSLSTFGSNRAAGWDLPTQYLAIGSYQQDQWVDLREGLAVDRIAAKWGEEPDQTAHAAVVAADGLETVAAANANLATRLAATTEAWNNAVGH